MIDNVIYQILVAASPIVALVGSNIFTAVAPQSGLTQYIVIHLIDMVPENTKDGVSMLDECRVQIDSFHSDKKLGDDQAVLIRTTLDRYRGTVGTQHIDKIIFDRAHNDYDYDRDVYQVIQEFIIRHKKT